MSARILFEQVWKRFHRGPAHDSLRDLIPALAKRLARRGAPNDGLGASDFWAVRDVSFEVQPGEALGIIGGNGAGKSTILKLLTKILRPTRGTARVEGRVGSLIEVSAGFHQDLSGRENVFLQGAIMGMPQQLIRERFDSIVDFSGVRAFIDTPVKRYSSGMNARLGFSIAVHLEPEVLVIDEVLSVGDAEFQQQAFERIKRMVQSDIPVVIVSHQLDRIVELCTDCILLRQGQIAFRGPAREAVHQYLHPGQQQLPGMAESQDKLDLRLHSIGNLTPQHVESGAPFTFRLSGEVAGEVVAPHLDVGLSVIEIATNQRLWWSELRTLGIHPDTVGRFDIEISMFANMAHGLYRVETFVWNDALQKVVGEGPAMLLQVIPGRPFSGTHQLSARGRNAAN